MSFVRITLVFELQDLRFFDLICHENDCVCETVKNWNCEKFWNSRNTWFSISCLSVMLYQLIIDNISPNIDHFPYCGFLNIGTYKEIIWTYLSFHPLSHPFEDWEKVGIKCVSKFSSSSRRSGALTGMFFYTYWCEPR